MRMMTGIFDRPMTGDDYDERNRPKDGCPTPWKHCWTLHVSWSWTSPRSLDRIRDRSPSRRPLSRLDDWCLGESCRLSAPCLHFQSELLDLWRSDPLELGRPTAETLETTDFGSQDPELVALVLVRFDLDFDGIVHGLSFTGFLRRLRRSHGLASRLLCTGLGLSFPSLRQPIFACETRLVLSTVINSSAWRSSKLLQLWEDYLYWP